MELASSCGADLGGSGCKARPLPNARVVVTTKTGQVLETLTGTDGGFRVTVPAGACSVVAAAPGVTGAPTHVVVTPGTATTGPVTLVMRGARHPM